MPHDTNGASPDSPALTAQPPLLVAPERPLAEALHTFWLLTLLRSLEYGATALGASALHPLGCLEGWVRLGRN